MLRVTVYTTLDEPPMEFDEVDFVSLVANTTYGPPALIAPDRNGGTRARVGSSVLYINTSLVPMWEIERTAD